MKDKYKVTMERSCFEKHNDFTMDNLDIYIERMMKREDMIFKITFFSEFNEKSDRELDKIDWKVYPQYVMLNAKDIKQITKALHYIGIVTNGVETRIALCELFSIHGFSDGWPVNLIQKPESNRITKQ